MKVSATDITMFRYCPRKYYYVKIEKREMPINENLIKGSLIHAIYKEFFERGLVSDEKYFGWFLTTGIPRLMDKEDMRINKLAISRERLGNFLVNSAQHLREAAKAGLVNAPMRMEQHVENEKFIARIDAIFDEGKKIGDVKIRLRNLDEVKLQLAVAALILESQGKQVTTGIAINAQEWQQVEFPITEEAKNEAEIIREDILRLYETKEKPECKCGRCDLEY